jgi:hypothetical protein
MADTEKTAEELAFDELAAVVREKDESKLSFSKYIERLEEQADAAARKLEVARAHAETCSATKLRKPRCDIGKPRKRTRLPAAPAAVAPVVENHDGPEG